MTSRTAQQHSQIASISLGAGYKLDDTTSVWSFAHSDRGSARLSKLSRRRFNILSAFKSLTNLASGKPPAVKPTEEYPSGCRGAKSILCTGILKMSSALLRAPMEPTVIHRTQPKSRPPLQQQTFQHQRHPHPQQEQLYIESFPLPPPQNSTATSPKNSTTTSPKNSTTTSPKNSTATSPKNSTATSPKNSTGQTSMDSSQKDHRKGGAGSPERKPPRHANHQHNITLPLSTVSPSSSNPIIRHYAHHNRTHHHRDNHVDTSPAAASPSPDSILTTIQESPLDIITPSILTVEKAAAAKIALEGYFNEKFASGPTDRECRRQVFETQLIAKSREARKGSSSAQMQTARARFCKQETNHLREVRVLKARGVGLLKMKEGQERNGARENGFEEVQILGKGSFGVVKLVRKREGGNNRRVYAMKCIRKGDMIKTQQEGHLKAERDFLIASEGCQWVVQLIASFQDLKNLYLVTEYMPGGDFLGFLIRQNTLPEEVARFYMAEMILAVEATHSLRFIHRDIKPNNFLISASGHLKISDFGLAFDGHWSHDLAYFTSHRYSLVNKLGLDVVGDGQDKEESRSTQAVLKWTSSIMTGIEKHQPKLQENGDGVGSKEPLLNWRNRNGNRGAAVSIMGTSQYMAPEVVKGECYDARCDYWSVAVILYECLYGSTPFFSEEGRTMTKKNILNHRETFHFPSRPAVTSRCQHLMASLIVEKENRLCSKRYKMKDLVMGAMGGQGGTGQGMGQQGMMTSSMSAPSLPALGFAAMGNFDGNGGGGGGGPVQTPNARLTKDYTGRFVFPYDAEDIKAHRWFKTIMWEHLHQMTPPHVPVLDSADDATYFDDESLSDWSESSREDSPPPPSEDDEDEIEKERLDKEGYHGMSKRMLDQLVEDQKRMEEGMHEEGKARLMSQLRRRPSLQRWVMEAMRQAPFDVNYYGGLEREIDKTGPEQGITLEEKDVMKTYLFRYGCRVYRDGEPKAAKDKKEDKKKKRPRDKILRDKEMGKVAMDVRRRTAFAGYEWVGCRGLDAGEVDVFGGQENVGLDGAVSRLFTPKLVQPQQEVQPQTPRQVVNVGMGMDGGYDGSPESSSTPGYRWGSPPQMNLHPPHALPTITGYAVHPGPFWGPPVPSQPQQFTHAQYQLQPRQFSPYQQQQQQPRQFRPPQHPPQQSRNHIPYQNQYQHQVPRHVSSPQTPICLPR
ncbi:putative serine/threonine-protein kinase [Triangularia setosa]|uniref:non-specific serine/threonine protein kinase n=1 Tax=Triangularia setosa TaxID=2587417 RepID=A0AAN6WIG7_9PEZI|nr:putative serine/threonine-protein kinase [Podospora setosa]